MKKICLGLSLALTIASAQAVIGEQPEEKKKKDQESREGLSFSQAIEQNRGKEEISEEVITPRETQTRASDREGFYSETETPNRIDIASHDAALLQCRLASSTPEPIEQHIVKTDLESVSDSSDKDKFVVITKNIVSSERLLTPILRNSHQVAPSKQGKSEVKVIQKKVTWDSAIGNDPIIKLKDEMDSLEKAVRDASTAMCKNQLSWKERYRSKLEPAAQRAFNIVEALPSEMNFTTRLKLIKKVVFITEQTFIAAQEGIPESFFTLEGGLEQETEHMKRRKEILAAIYKFANQTKENIETTLEYFDQIKSYPDDGDVIAFLESSQKVDKSNSSALRELRALVVDDQAERATWEEKSNVDLRAQSSTNFFQQEESSLLLQRAINHVTKRCQEILEVAKLLDLFYNNQGKVEDREIQKIAGDQAEEIIDKESLDDQLVARSMMKHSQQENGSLLQVDAIFELFRRSHQIVPEGREPQKRVMQSLSVIPNDRVSKLKNEMSCLQSKVEDVTHPMYKKDRSWIERYKLIEPFAQKAIEIVETLPSEATFTIRVELLKIAIKIADQALITAYENMCKLFPFIKNSDKEKTEVTGKLLEEVKREGEIFEAINNFNRRIQDYIRKAMLFLNRIGNDPDDSELSNFLESSKKIDASNSRVFKELRALIIGDQVEVVIKEEAPNIETMEGQNSMNLSRQENSSLLRQKVINHVTMMYKQNLEIASLLELFAKPTFNTRVFNQPKKSIFDMRWMGICYHRVRSFFNFDSKS